MRHARNIIAKLGPEARECAAFVQWFRLQYPRQARNATHIPNGRAKPMDKIINAELGTRPGVSDYGIFWRLDPFAGLWMEAKRTGARWSDVDEEQAKWLGRMGEQGFFPAVGYGLDHMKEIARLYFGLPGTLGELLPHLWNNRISATRIRTTPLRLAESA